LARREVLIGKAKFGITGDGKELPQFALSEQFEAGDWRAGYYRDQTLILALGLTDVEGLFAQLYANPDGDSFSGGRMMNSHFATPNIDAAGRLLPLAETVNSSADISSTAGQVARGLGLALASKKFRALGLGEAGNLSREGREISWVTIGDASTSEGVFWEAMNAAGVLQVPMVVSVWDDGYGISVPVEFQTTKSSISAALAGLQRDKDHDGIEIIRARAWHYPELKAAYKAAAELARERHIPVLVHVVEVTQQLGHSTSGSHERYKDAERLAFEREFDCNARFRAWLLQEGHATSAELEADEERAQVAAKQGQQAAWKANQARLKVALELALGLLPEDAPESKLITSEPHPGYTEAHKALRRYAMRLEGSGVAVPEEVVNAIASLGDTGHENYNTLLHQEGDRSITAVAPVAGRYKDDGKTVPGSKVLKRYFDHLLQRDERVMAFGEDVGHIGDVNQGFAGLQEKYGKERVFDTGIREWTIVGQAIGLSLRGFRPIAEIQYLDYLVYALSPLTDDLATTLYRTDGQQVAPVIIRTRGHRLEGIWHSGSPLGMIINSVRGMVVAVPRDMVQAVGMYNALFKASEPAIVIETLNAYRLREVMPENIEEYTVAIGQPEVLVEGTACTVLTYGACVAVCLEAAELLKDQSVAVEIIDAQTLLPFDVNASVRASLEKTNRLLIVDEDVPGGASAYLLNEVLQTQEGFRLLDAAPVTLAAKAHRTPYGTDGDYFTKPHAEDVAESVLRLIKA